MTALTASVSATFVFAGQPIAAVIDRARAAGFAALEFQVIDAAFAERHAAAIEEAEFEVALINLDVGDLSTGGPGLSAVPARRNEFAAALAEGVAIARRLRPAVVHIGPSRVPDAASRDVSQRVLCDNIQRACDALAPLGCAVSVEVLNRRDFPDLAVDSLDCAAELIARVGGENVILQYDIYHAAVDGRDILRDLADYRSLIGHIQFADSPGRGEPGTGTLDFADYFGALRSADYHGYVGAEYAPTAADDFAWMTLLRGK